MLIGIIRQFYLMPLLADILPLSRYFSHLLEARPELACEVAAAMDQRVDAAALRTFLPVVEAGELIPEEMLKPALRRLKQRGYARIGARDLAGSASLDEVTECMTAIAEIAIETALQTLSRSLQARYGMPRNAQGEAQELIVIGMGKLGGGELNVSSDIDLIFVYPEEGETDGDRSISNFDFFTRLGRNLINALADVTDQGQVFRVDMRLRPHGESGPLVCSFEMLENYLVSQGREWERYAWIKARALTGSPKHLEELEALRLPFVFRKYLDFGAINAMRGLHAQIRREVARRDMAVNIKLGPGGIREIEFIAQVFQLIRGGRDKELQAMPTQKVLRLLAARAHLSVEAVQELLSAYAFLRRLEHRLQYLDDAQTHTLPEQPVDQALIARAMGFARFEALLIELDDHRANVARHFDAVFADRNDAQAKVDGVWLANGDQDQAAALAAAGYRDANAAARRLLEMRESARYQQMTASVRERFDALLPQVIAAASATPQPDQTLARILELLEAVARRSVYLELLLEYPQALKKVAELTGASGWAADYLKRHPVLLDELLDPRLLDSAPDWPAFKSQLESALAAAAPDTEQQMDLMREAHHAQVLRLLAQDVAGLWPLERLSDHLSELADIMLDLTLRYAWRKIAKRHIEVPHFAIISYGKLGGKELGYASDLDVIFLFDDRAPEAQENYARLAMRINTWISSQTSAGILFETDLRLRPNGDSGLMVSSVDAFRKYQLESAWVWEHQALTRARYSAGDGAVGTSFERIRCEILSQPRDLDDLKREVLAMRDKMLAAHSGGHELFDLKQDRGGLIDVEFIVQYLVLGYAHRHAELTGNLGNIALLKIAAQLSLVPMPLADAVANAYREYRRMQHALRLNNVPAHVEASVVAEHVTAVRALWRHAFATE